MLYQNILSESAPYRLFVTGMGAEVGLHEPKTFCRVFREVEGISPGEYRKKR